MGVPSKIYGGDAKMIDKILEQYETDKKVKLYRPTREDLLELYGNIDVYLSEKRFASAKCCMCCR